MRAIRALAIGIAAMGVVDPPWTLHQRSPVAVDVHADNPSSAAETRGELERRLGGAVTFESSNEPVAVVLVGGSRVAAALGGDEVPVSTVAVAGPSSPNVRIVEAVDPARVRVGWAATFEAVVEARGLAGKTSSIVLETRGVELARLAHTWASDVERFKASLRYSPPREGASTVTVKAIPLDGETTDADNAADLWLAVSGRRLKVLVHEPRPSWNATFVRRALEEDATFEVSTVVRTSKGLAVRGGTPPPVLTADALNGFDAVIVGAPEELGVSEVDALRLFARRRGGAVVLVPDRRPSGRYLDLMPSSRFDEVLVGDALVLTPLAGTSLRASELAVSDPASSASANVLSSVGQNQSTRPVVLEWLTGEGRVLFSGALDAWRYRGATDDGFSRFWRARIAEAAEAAPARLAVSFAPGAPGVGDEVVIHARLRRTELDVSNGTARVPAVNARLIASSGEVQAVRLWPMAEPGTFVGRVRFAEAGNVDLQVATEAGAVVDETISVATHANHPRASDESTAEALKLVANATGGVAVGSDLRPLERHLRSLSSGEIERVVHPWRSPWMLVGFVGLLSLEWVMRRRQGYP